MPMSNVPVPAAENGKGHETGEQDRLWCVSGFEEARPQVRKRSAKERLLGARVVE